MCSRGSGITWWRYALNRVPFSFKIFPWFTSGSILLHSLLLSLMPLLLRATVDAFHPVHVALATLSAVLSLASVLLLSASTCVSFSSLVTNLCLAFALLLTASSWLSFSLLYSACDCHLATVFASASAHMLCSQPQVVPLHV